MASGDNPRLPLTAGASPVVKYSEMLAQADTPSTTTTITMSTGADSPANFARASEPSHAAKKNDGNMVNSYELRRMPTQQRRYAKKALMSNVGYRLARRKELYIER